MVFCFWQAFKISISGDKNFNAVYIIFLVEMVIASYYIFFDSYQNLFGMSWNGIINT
jgi:hypothetical protein